ncbi:MAG: hypothetical protein NVS3B28_03680 [Candidatus Velthaea sp.]
MSAQTQTYGLLVALFVLALIIRRTLTTQTVRVWALVVVPLLIAFVALTVISATPPSSVLGVAAIVLAAIAGAALGYARGIHSKVELGPKPGTLIVQGNVLLVLILVAAFAVRYAVRSYVGAAGPAGILVSDAFIVFAAASVGVARAMLFFTWRRLVAGPSSP